MNGSVSEENIREKNMNGATSVHPDSTQQPRRSLFKKMCIYALMLSLILWEETNCFCLKLTDSRVDCHTTSHVMLKIIDLKEKNMYICSRLSALKTLI